MLTGQSVTFRVLRQGCDREADVKRWDVAQTQIDNSPLQRGVLDL